MHTRTIGGFLAVRRTRFRRAGAVLGVLAVLVQCLVIAVHHPAQAAAPSPFDDPHAWCLTSSAEGGPALPDQGAPKAPLHQGVICPICTSLQAAGPGLLPVVAALVQPLSVQRPTPVVVAGTAAPQPFGHSAANPRAPPVSL